MQRREQPGRDADLADGHRVDPDSARQIGRKGAPEASPDVAHPAAAEGAPQESEGGVGGQGEGGQNPVEEQSAAIISDDDGRPLARMRAKD